MFEVIKNTATAEFQLCADGPVLVRSKNSNELDPRLPDSVFLSGSDGKENAFIIPGSSLKGVIRSYVGKNFPQTIKEEELFGCVEQEAGINRKSKISFHDAYADMKTVKETIRYSTAINPVIQNTKQGSLNNLFAVTQGTFNASFKIVNFSDEEFKAIIKAFDSMNKGFVRIGGKVSRGFGKMKIGSFKMKITEGFDDNLNPIVKKEYTDFNALAKEVL